jgi:ABC-2 type transport system ATP-binding protein
MKIELRGVTKSFGKIRALDGLTLQIEPGQIISLLGPNGAGKTTLLRTLAGLAAPDKGAVFCDEVEFTRDKLELRRKVFFLPDFPCHFWDQSIIRNIAIVLRLFEADGPGAETRVLQLLREFDLLPLALRAANSLSRGQAYKAALTAMMATTTDLWLLDEPFASGMDPHGIEVFKRHAREAAARGQTVFYSTQLLDVAERFSDRVCVIHNGQVRAFDTLSHLREQAGDKNNVLEEIFRQLREQPE